MNVLVVFPGFFVVGGMASVVKDFDTQYAEYGYHVSYIETHNSNGKWSFFSFSISIIRFTISLIINNIDVVHIHTASRGSFIRKSIFCFLSKIFKKRTVLHIHGGGFADFYNNNKPFFKVIISYILRKKVDSIIVLSPFWKSWFETTFILTRPPIIVRNSVREYSKPIQKNNSEKNIIFVGRLVPEKGVDDLIEAISLIPRNYNFKLSFIGSGDPRFENKCSQLGLAGLVQFDGFLSRDLTLSRIASADILVLPSYFEGVPVVILEAMACRTTVVATTVGGIPDVISDGLTGFLFPPGDVEQLSFILTNLLSNPKRCNSISENAYNEWLSNYTFDKNFPILLNALKGVY